MLAVDEDLTVGGMIDSTRQSVADFIAPEIPTPSRAQSPCAARNDLSVTVPADPFASAIVIRPAE